MEPSERYVAAKLTERILGCAMEVHRELGPGLLESTYRSCLRRALDLAGMAARSEVPISIEFRGLAVDAAYRADLIVEREVIIELKAVERLLPIHEAQILTYMKLAKMRVGLLLNFNVQRLQYGIRRYVR